MTHSQRRDDLEVEASLCRLCPTPTPKERQSGLHCTTAHKNEQSPETRRPGPGARCPETATLLTFALTGILPTFQGFCLFVFISPAVDIQHKKIPQIEK